MNIRNVAGSMALAVTLNACSDKAEKPDARGTEPALAQRQVELAKSTAALDAMAAEAPSDWHALVPFVPERLGEFVQQGEIDGEFTSIAGMQASRVTRKYEAGLKTLFVTITDAIGAAELRAPFALAATLHADSTSGYQKGKRFGDHPAMAVWQANVNRSEVTVLVAKRYVVKVDVRQAATDDEAEKLLVMLDIDGLAKLRPSAK